MEIEVSKKDNSNIGEAELIWKKRDNGVSYIQSSGLSERIRKNTDFYEGNQWATPTKDTIGMPRPVIDITSFTVNNKLSKVSGIPVDIIFSCNEDQEIANMINNFWNYWRKSSKFEKKYKNAIKKAAIHCGALLFFSYYNNKINLEIIRADDVFVADSRSNESIQEQDWVIIQQRIPLEKVRRIADNDIDKQLIKSDTEYLSNSNNALEQSGTDMCTLLHYFFRVNGEVYYERIIRGLVITKARPLAPDINAAKRTDLYKFISREIDLMYGIDSDENQNEADEFDEQSGQKPLNEVKAGLYPFTYITWYDSENSFYGRSEVDNLISDQVAINASMGMLLLGSQSESTGKTVARRNALGNQKITNNPMQVLIDNTPSGNGYYKLAPTQLSNASVTLINNIVTLVRATKGVSEVSTGEAYGANASGAAIAQLQSQANSSSELIRDHIWEQLSEFGSVLLQMWKLYFSGNTKVQFKYSKFDETENKTNTYNGEFDGSKYKNIEDIDITVKAIKGTNSSTAGDIQLIEAALAAKAIDFEDAIRMYPDSAISDKNRYLKVIQERTQKESVVLIQQIQQLTQMIEQIKNQSVQKDKYIEKLIEVVNTTKDLRNQAASIVKYDEDLKNTAIQEGAKRISTEKSLEMTQQALWNASSDVARLENEKNLESALQQAQKEDRETEKSVKLSNETSQNSQE